MQLFWNRNFEEMKVQVSIKKTLLFAGKVVLFILSAILTTYICFLTFIYASEWFYPEFYGSYALGGDIYMMDWDGGGRIIVRGTNIKGNTCYGGERLIPTYENGYDNAGNIAEYVVYAKNNETWIIARTDNNITNQRKYYLIYKNPNLENMTTDSIIATQIESFTDSVEFSNVCVTLRGLI